MSRKKQCTVALAGNPNVGKSTVFNALTGSRQHTGNWTGKTVAAAKGYCETEKCSFELIDLPGTYSLIPHSLEEAVTGDFIKGGGYDGVVAVCDAACLERNLILVLQILKITQRVIVCVNLMDEAKKRGIEVDLKKLSQLLGVPAVGTVAKKKKSLEKLVRKMEAFTVMVECGGEKCNFVDGNDGICSEVEAKAIVSEAERISRLCVRGQENCYSPSDRRIDRIFTGKYTAFPLMAVLLSFILWLTIVGANYPSQVLSDLLFGLQDRLTELFMRLNAPAWLHGALVFGVYRVLAWVVSVMLPPMAIFFPLFTLLEDSGYLPRIAYNLDKPFKKCCACGKQALTMW